MIESREPRESMHASTARPARVIGPVRTRSLSLGTMETPNDLITMGRYSTRAPWLRSKTSSSPISPLWRDFPCQKMRPDRSLTISRDILKYAESLKDIELEGVPPMSHATEGERFRPDEAKHDLTQGTSASERPRSGSRVVPRASGDRGMSALTSTGRWARSRPRSRRRRPRPARWWRRTSCASHEKDGAVGAFLARADEAARAEAKAIDARLARGEDPGPLRACRSQSRMSCTFTDSPRPAAPGFSRGSLLPTKPRS